MGWELETRLAKMGVSWRDADGLARLAEKNGDAKTVAKLESIRKTMTRHGAENAAACRPAAASAAT